jgi:plasmid rolling circle replication initiator protein Rep
LGFTPLFRCKDPLCPNCRRQNINKAINKLAPAFNMMMVYKYNPYLMTLTVPNIESIYLSKEIDKMNKAFSKLWRWLYRPFYKDGKYAGGYKDRLFDAMGAIKALEVNVQKSDWSKFNVHFHVIVFLTNDCPVDFIKKYNGGHQYRTESYIAYSDADIFIQKLWKMAYDDKGII